jgi:hypothetical protein
LLQRFDPERPAWRETFEVAGCCGSELFERVLRLQLEPLHDPAIATGIVEKKRRLPFFQPSPLLRAGPAATG